MPIEPMYEGHDLEVLCALPRYYGWIYDYFEPHLNGHGAEFGPGLGTNSARILLKLVTLDLIEPSPNLVSKLQERFASDKRVRIIASGIEGFVETSPDNIYDTIVLINVLEHVHDDVAAVQSFYRLLRPGGHLLLFVPAVPILFSRLDKLLGHYRRYSLVRLTQIITKANFEIRVGRYFDALGVFPWFLINTLGRATRFNPYLAWMYDTAGVPLTRMLESLMPPLFGKNICLVAQKPNPSP